MQAFTPSYDNKITQKYSVKTLDHKAHNKISLQEEHGWVAEPKRPLICIPGEITKAAGGDLLMEILPGIMELPVELIVRGKGAEAYGKSFAELEKKHGHRVRIVRDDEESVRAMLAASDIALFTSESNEENLLENVLRYGVIPVSPKTKLLENYNPVQETGNAFVAEDATVWQLFAALVRALETHKFPFDWRTIQRHAMETC